MAERFPAYLAPEPDTPRSQRSRAILAGDHRFTFAEWTQLGLDTKIGIAAARVPELLTEFAKLSPGGRGESGGPGERDSQLGPGGAQRFGGHHLVRPHGDPGTRQWPRPDSRAGAGESGPGGVLRNLEGRLGRGQPAAACAYQRNGRAVQRRAPERPGAGRALVHGDDSHLRHARGARAEAHVWHGGRHLRQRGGVRQAAGGALAAGARRKRRRAIQALFRSGGIVLHAALQTRMV